MLSDNRKILSKKNDLIYEELKEYNTATPKNVFIESAKNNESTLKMSDGNTDISIHSRYNPSAEMETFLRQFENIEKYDHILFIGTGLGYHIKEVLRKFKQINFSIYEPNIEILHFFLNEVNLNTFGISRLQSIFTNPDQLSDIKEFSKQIGNNTLIITWPFTQKYFSEQIHELLSIVRDTLKNKKHSISISAAFQKRWIVNSLKNFPRVLETPNIIDLGKSYIKNKPVILVAAGPSLSYEFENLKYIKKNGMAYIFSVGSAVNSLIENDVIPDATLAYDPSKDQYKVLEKIKSKNLEIPLIFGSSISFEALQNYYGPMIHMITSQDTISKKLLDNSKNLGILQDSTSITHLAFQMITLLGASKIIFVGQNFAYLENKRYAEGIKYDFISNNLTNEEEKNVVYIEGVHGEKIASSESYIKMKEILELYIASSTSISVINTTKYGAEIKGTKFKPLEFVIKTDLKIKNLVNRDWFTSSPTYDIKFVESKMRDLNLAYNNITSEIGNAYIKLEDINKTLSSNKLRKLEYLYGEFDLTISKMRNNTFYLTIIEPMIRVQNEVFYENIKNIKYEQNVRIKAKVILESFGKILDIVQLNHEFVKPIFEEFKSEIKEKGVYLND